METEKFEGPKKMVSSVRADSQAHSQPEGHWQTVDEGQG